MKKLSLFIIMLAFALGVTAQNKITVKPKHGGNQHGNATLTVTSPRNQSFRFWLYVDDVLQNEQSARSVCVRNLEEDSYYVRVELDNTLQNCVGQFVDLRQSQTLAIVHSDKWYGLETTDMHIRPELTVDLVTGQSESNVVPPVPPVPPTPYGMNPQDYEEACQLISKESFDSSKLTVAEQVVTSNPVTASQILGICKLFSFESNKLSFAKTAYPYCVDKNKYYLLNEAFSYESSKRELNEFIKNF
jgi:hypothetical protein